MTVSRKLLCGVYGLIAVLALVGTWANNFAYINLGFVGATLKFWPETLVNPASRSITVDILFLGLAVMVWMVLEARRLSIRFVWAYILAGIFIAISVSVPVFLIVRERALAAREPGAPAGSMARADAVGLVVIGLGAVAYTCASLMGVKP